MAAEPDAFVVAHPECPTAVLQHAGYIGSTSALIDYCVHSDHRSFIVMTESGVQHSLRKLAPEKSFTFVSNENCNCSECPFMKRNSLEKLRDALQSMSPKVELPEATMNKARTAIERMLAVK
jgi:quinolinate synthase